MIFYNYKKKCDLKLYKKKRHRSILKMRQLIIYSLIIGLIYCIESEDESRASKSYKTAGMSLNHPGMCEKANDKCQNNTVLI